MLERGLPVDHPTIYRWVQCYAPELEKRCRPPLKARNDSWRVDETSIKVKKVWMYLYRAVDSEGNTLEFLLSSTRDTTRHSLSEDKPLFLFKWHWRLVGQLPSGVVLDNLSSCFGDSWSFLTMPLDLTTDPLGHFRHTSLEI
jgi:hypothetical protein